VLMFTFLSVRGWVRLPLLLLLGFTALSVTPVVMAVMQERFPDNRALATGVYSALGSLIRALAVVVVGGIGDLLSIEVSFLASAGVVILGLPWILMLSGSGEGEGTTVV
jgi:MFS transporter, FSR family, fosmidomycin resistance protein